MNKTVNIQIKNDNYAYLTCEDAGLFRLLKMSFTRRVRKYNNYWRIYEDKQNVHFGLVNNGTILKVKAGLISFLTNSLSERNLSYALRDERIKADFKTQPVFELSDKVELRDYQKEAVVAALNARYCSVQLTTGSGKTEVAASIIRTYLATNFTRAVLYVVPTIKLQLEAEERFTKYGIKCNTKLPFISGYANIITYTSLVRSKIPYQEKDRVGALIFDECHHLKGPKNSKIVHEYKKLGMIIGLSATVTPDVQYKEKLNRLNDDDFSILGCTGKTVYYKEIDETIAENFVTPVEITVLDNPEKVPLTEDELSEWHSLRRKVLMSPYRAKLVAQFTNHICEQKDFNTIMLLIPEVDWSQQYMLEVAKYNPNYRIILMFGQNRYGEVINGQIIPLYRKDKEQAYADIKNPNVKTIFSATSFAYEGMDVTNMQALINVYGGKSVTRVKQQAGRVMRLFADKDMAYIYEIYDKQPVLKAQLKKRLDIYDKEYHARILKSNFKMEE